MKKLLVLGLLAMVASTLPVTATFAQTETKHGIIIKPDVLTTTFTITATSVDAIVFVAEPKAAFYVVNEFECLPVVTKLTTTAFSDVGWRSRSLYFNHTVTNGFKNYNRLYKDTSQKIFSDCGLFARRCIHKC